MSIRRIIRKAQIVKDFDIVKESTEIILQNSEYLANLLAIQMATGKDGNNEPVTIFGRDFYSDLTIENKRRNGFGLGKITDRITNYMSGAFYDGFNIVAHNDATFHIESNVPYFEDIIKRSGSSIMKLNKEHIDDFEREILKPQLKERLDKRINSV